MYQVYFPGPRLPPSSCDSHSLCQIHLPPPSFGTRPSLSDKVEGSSYPSHRPLHRLACSRPSVVDLAYLGPPARRICSCYVFHRPARLPLTGSLVPGRRTSKPRACLSGLRRGPQEVDRGRSARSLADGLETGRRISLNLAEDFASACGRMTNRKGGRSLCDWVMALSTTYS